MNAGMLLLSVVLLGFHDARELATVRITLVSTYGSPIPQVGDFTLTNRKDRKVVFTSSRPVFENVPYGGYNVQVVPGVLGFEEGSRIVKVDRKDVQITLGLQVVRVEDSNVTEVIGKIAAVRQSGIKLKLVSLHTDVVKETRVDARGRFRLKDVPFGAYTLLVLKNGRTCDSRPLDVIYDSKNLNIDLSSNSCR